MQAPLHVDGVSDRVDPLLVFCARCTHSEFIHRDRGTRACLYSECGCASFDVTVGNQLQRRSAKATSSRANRPKEAGGVGSAHGRVREESRALDGHLER